MNIAELAARCGPVEAGLQMHELIAELYPICRSITGDGFRQTLRRIQGQIPIEICEVPSGTPVFDWEVPKEWNIRDAYIKNSTGERVVDFARSNLHVVSYSVPVRRKMSLEELRPNLHSLPEFPDRIPYRTAYYAENWGFCLSHQQYLALTDGEYEVCIDSTLAPGHLTYGELLLPGKSSEEILISCHACHPSLCNDNLSGISLATRLARELGPVERRYSYRFLFIPGTIGSITWLALNEDKVARIRHGIVLTCVGDPGPSTYKKSRRGNAGIDRALQHVLQHSGKPYEIMDFIPYGYDERQYCSPGFNLPVGCLMRTPHGRFPEYHTSADNLEFVRPGFLGDSFCKCLSALSVLEQNRIYRNTNPKCEPRLGKRGLYRNVAGQKDLPSLELALLWVLNLSDGGRDLLAIAEQSGLPFTTIAAAADALRACALLEECAATP